MTIVIYIWDQDLLMILTNQYSSYAVIYMAIKEVNEDEFSFVLCECCRENVDQINFRSVCGSTFYNVLHRSDLALVLVLSRS